MAFFLPPTYHAGKGTKTNSCVLPSDEDPGSHPESGTEPGLASAGLADVPPAPAAAQVK